MIVINLLFLPFFLVFGQLASLSDIRTGKIKNSLIKKGYLTAFIVYSILLFYSVLRYYNINFFSISFLNFSFFTDTLVNAIISFIVGYAFWRFNFWAAADAKLFSLLVLFIPVSIYSFGKINYFPSFTFLYNVYLLYIIWLTYKFFKNKKSRNDPFNLKTFFAEKYFSGMNLFLLLLPVAYLIIFFLGMFKHNNFLLVLVAFAFIYILNFYSKKVFASKKIKLAFGCLIFPFMIYAVFSNGSQSIKQFVIFSVIMITIKLLIALVQMLADEKYKRIKIDDLKSGMIIFEKSIRYDKSFPLEELGTIYPDGLTEEQCLMLKSKFKEKNKPEINVYETNPFAPFIYLGGLATYAFRGSIIYWIIDLIK